LSDEKYMLDMQDWKATLRDEGRAEGIAQGINQGKAEGRAEGIVEGIAQTAQRMKSLGFSAEQIRAVTGI